MKEINRRTALWGLTLGGVAALAAVGASKCSKDPRAIRVAMNAPVPLWNGGPIANYTGLTSDREHFILSIGANPPQMYPRQGQISFEGRNFNVMRADSLDLYLGEVR